LVAKFHDTFRLKGTPPFRIYGRLAYRELQPSEIAESLIKAERFLAAEPEGGATPGTGITIDQYMAAYQTVPGPTMRFLATLKE